MERATESREEEMDDIQASGRRRTSNDPVRINEREDGTILLNNVLIYKILNLWNSLLLQ